MVDFDLEAIKRNRKELEEAFNNQLLLGIKEILVVDGLEYKLNQNGLITLVNTDVEEMEKLGDTLVIYADTIELADIPYYPYVDSHDYSHNIKNVIMPFITRIPKGYFRRNDAIEFIFAPNLLVIAAELFSNCHNLREVIVNSASRIDNNAFINCMSLVKVECTKVHRVHAGAFANSAITRYEIKSKQLANIQSNPMFEVTKSYVELDKTLNLNKDGLVEILTKLKKEYKFTDGVVYRNRHYYLTHSNRVALRGIVDTEYGDIGVLALTEHIQVKTRKKLSYKVIVAPNLISINKSTFADNDTLEVFIAPNLSSMGKDAFSNCPNFRALYAPKLCSAKKEMYADILNQGNEELKNYSSLL